MVVITIQFRNEEVDLGYAQKPKSAEIGFVFMCGWIEFPTTYSLLICFS